MYNTLVIGSAENTMLSTVLFVSLSFLILMLCIKKFAWGPITKMLDDRAERIAHDIDSAEEAKISANSLIKQSEEELLNSKSEAVSIIKKANNTAETSAEAIVAEAKEHAARLKAKAKKDIEIEREQMLEAAKQEVADLSVQIASKILQKELNKETHEELINSFVEGLGSNHED